MSTFPLLFSPLSLRGLTLRNRIVMLPMGTRLVSDGRPTDAGIAFYEARAAGGVGLVIVGGTSAHQSTAHRDRRSVEAFDPDVVPTLARLADRVHRHGAKIFGQLMHLGRENYKEGEEADWPAMGPSPVPGLGPTVPHEMTHAEIEEIIEGYARSSANMRRAGYDGIEIQANHGFLVAQFLATRANRRQDEYGGPLANRMRLLYALVDAVRERIGEEAPLGVRLSADEEVEGGMGVPEASEIVRLLEATRSVDYVSLSVGLSGNAIRDMFTPAGSAVASVAAVKRVTRLPVIASQRITHPALAEGILSSGSADLVGLARALIADPDWASRAREGRSGEIRPCVGALQGCHSWPIGCLHNPEAGRELTWRPGSLGRERPSRSRRVVVVGAGPAGLEAALTAARRGHSVTVYEREGVVGGQVALAAKAPGRAELHGVVSYRHDELRRLGVDIRLATPVGAEQVIGQRADCVVLATGARPRRPAFEGGDLAHVLSVWRLFDGSPEVSALLARARSAVVIDDGSGAWEACGSAEHLSQLGLAVHLVTPAASVGLGVFKESQRPLLRRLRHHGVRFHPNSRVLAVEPGAVTICDGLRLDADKVIEAEELEADVVVAYAGREVEQSLTRELEGRVSELHAIGDCVAPRYIREAVLEGYRVGRAI